VGYSSGVALAERWNGSAWQVQPTPNPSASTELLGVSCTTADTCTAVGNYYTTIDTSFTLAEHWNGSKWEIQPTPNPADAFESQLNGVSCATTRACTAVGNYLSNSGTFTLAEGFSL
jgi:hypothetical protein